MAKNAITDYDTDPANNTDVGNIGTLGTNKPSNFDNSQREIMSHLAKMNAGTSPLHDTFTLSDPDDATKQFRFDGVNITTGQKRIITVPDKDILLHDAKDNGVLSGYRNKIINGNFDIWQRGTSQTTSGYGSADRWDNQHNGSTKTTSKQDFTLGQTDVVGEPTSYLRTIVNSAAGAANYVQTNHNIEGVKTLSGKTATLTFYAKADATKDISIDLLQVFGTGGSPSAAVAGIGQSKYSLTTAWQKFSAVISIPSIAGKTLGTNNDDHLRVRVWFDAGSDYDASTGTLGQQSGTFDIAHVSLVEGDATLEDDPFSPRHIQQELALCQRYYERVYAPSGAFVLISTEHATSNNWADIRFKVRKRTFPSVATFAGGSWVGSSPTGYAGVDSYHWSSTGPFYWSGSDLGFNCEI